MQGGVTGSPILMTGRWVLASLTIVNFGNIIYAGRVSFFSIFFWWSKSSEASLVGWSLLRDLILRVSFSFPASVCSVSCVSFVHPRQNPTQETWGHQVSRNPCEDDAQSWVYFFQTLWTLHKKKRAKTILSSWKPLLAYPWSRSSAIVKQGVRQSHGKD